MILQQYIRILLRWWWLIVFSATLAGAAAFFLSRELAPVYSASTTLLVNPAPVTNAVLDLDTLRASTSLGRTYIEMLRHRPVVEAVIAELALEVDAKTLVKNITIALVPNTQLLVVTVEDTDPQRAADIANGMVRAFTAQNQARQAQRYVASKESLQQELARLQTEIRTAQNQLAVLRATPTPNNQTEQERLQALIAQYTNSYATVLNSFESVRLAEAQATDNLEIVEEAQAERTPQRPTPTQNALLAAFLGALAALGIVLLVEHLDQSVRSSEEVESITNLGVLAAIGRLNGGNRLEKLVTLTQPYSELAEDYRLLRTKLEFAIMDQGIQTLLVTSSETQEGKSTTLANLAVALAQTGKRVILVDTNLRAPTLHEFFEQLPPSPGLTALLQHELVNNDFLAPNSVNESRLLQSRQLLVSDALMPTGIANLCLLPAGPLPPNPAELLGSQWMLELMADLKLHADVVLLDSPPVLAAVDALLLTRSCDTTLLVAQAGATPAGALRKAQEQLLQAGANLAGVVLNSVPTSHRRYQQFYQHGGKPASPNFAAVPVARVGMPTTPSASQAQVAPQADDYRVYIPAGPGSSADESNHVKG